MREKTYFYVNRKIFTKEYRHLSKNAKWLFVILSGLEQEFCNDGKNCFWRTDEQLTNDTGMSSATVKRAKKELLKTDLVKTWQGHFIDKDGNKSEKHCTFYRINKESEVNENEKQNAV